MEHLEMEGAKDVTSCQGKVVSVRSTAACLDWQVMECVSEQAAFKPSLRFASLHSCHAAALITQQ